MSKSKLRFEYLSLFLISIEQFYRIVEKFLSNDCKRVLGTFKCSERERIEKVSVERFFSQSINATDECEFSTESEREFTIQKKELRIYF